MSLELYVTKMREVEQEFGITKSDLLRVCQYESGNMPWAINGLKAAGLIQFLPSTLPRVGWTKTPEAFTKLSEVDQVPYIRRYVSAYAGRMHTLRQVYAAVFTPAYIDQCADPEYVISVKGKPIYNMNASFDENGDGKIQAEELAAAARRACRGARWSEIASYLGGGSWTGLYHGTIFWLQTCLAAKGYYLGEIDGAQGKLTLAAIKAYQKDRGLTPDGLLGPNTTAALKKEFGWQV